MSCARHDVCHVAVVGQDTRHRLYDCFHSLVRREQTKCKQHRLPTDPKSVFVKIRINEREIWNSVWDDVNLCCRHMKDVLEKLRGVLTHDNEAIGELCQLDHYATLVGVRLAQNCMQRRDNGHADLPQ